LAEDQRLAEEYETTLKQQLTADETTTVVVASKPPAGDDDDSQQQQQQRSVRIPRKIAHMYEQNAGEGDVTEPPPLATASPSARTRTQLKRQAVVEVERRRAGTTAIAEDSAVTLATAETLASAQETNLWLLALSRFYDEIYQNLQSTIGQQSSLPVTDVTAGVNDSVSSVNKAKSTNRSVKRSAEPLPPPDAPEERQSGPNSGDANPVDELNYLYQVAVGELIPPPQSADDLNNSEMQQLQRNNYRSDPLFHQFLAWKRWNELQRKRSLIERLAGVEEVPAAAKSTGKSSKSAAANNSTTANSNNNNNKRSSNSSFSRRRLANNHR
jgi:hypothetical protein